MQDNIEILLYSGGWDSTCASYIYPNAKKLYIDLKTPYSKVEIKNLPPDVKIIELNLQEFVMQNGHHIAQRNAILALIAVNYGMTFRKKNIKIIIAGMKEDVNMSDKNPQYFEKLSEFINLFYNLESNQSEYYNVEVVGFFEDDKISLWEKAGKPNMRNVVSCYSENGSCEKCLDCYRRLLLLDYIYPSEYKINKKEMINKLTEAKWLISNKLL